MHHMQRSELPAKPLRALQMMMDELRDNANADSAEAPLRVFDRIRERMRNMLRAGGGRGGGIGPLSVGRLHLKINVLSTST